jgi:hypothetical protein
MHIYKHDLLFFVGEKNIISYMEHGRSCEAKSRQATSESLAFHETRSCITAFARKPQWSLSWAE